MSKPKAVMHKVPLVATKSSDGTYDFRPKSEIWDDSEEEFVFSKDRHGMKSHDYHLIEFKLDDQTGDDLKFPNVPHDAMWVCEGSRRSTRKCPDVNTNSDFSVMEPICVCDDGKRLLVRNDNPRKEDWAFTLNFVKRGEDSSDPNRYVNWDPGGANQDGGSKE